VWVRTTKEYLRSPFVPSGTRAGAISQRTGHVAGMEETKIFLQYWYKFCWKAVISNAEIIEE
jgi:hypothetical protein